MRRADLSERGVIATDRTAAGLLASDRRLKRTSWVVVCRGAAVPKHSLAHS
jgi:hypothetical protein